MRTILGCAAVLIMSGTVGAADPPPGVDGKKLIGHWIPADAKKDTRLTVEFTKTGTMAIISAGGGKEFKVAGSYKLDGDQLTMTLKLKGSETSEVVTITKLTDTVLEGRTEKGRKESFTRAKAE